ncbi:MAG TPA: hypothetical protein VG871_22625 [Vicinamibacterales bacterium]|nr:hypothetical protein [Vicinamibacterales bacterium]
MVTACGSNNNSGTDAGGGGGGGSDAGGSAQVNCDPLDLAGAPEVPLTFGSDVGSAAEAAAQGGTLAAGTYVADVVELDQSYSALVSGSAAGRIELTPSNATAGAARVALSINATALGMALDDNLTGAGTYTVGTDNGITISNADCGSGSGSGSDQMLPELFYTSAADGVTLWGTYDANVGGTAIAVPIKIHIHQ